MAGEVDAVNDKFGKLEFFCISVEAVAMCVTRVVVNPTAQLFPPVIHLKLKKESPGAYFCNGVSVQSGPGQWH